MSFFVFKTHVIPTGKIFREKVYQWYMDGLEKNGVLPSTFDINFKIKKKWKRRGC